MSPPQLRASVRESAVREGTPGADMQGVTSRQCSVMSGQQNKLGLLKACIITTAWSVSHIFISGFRTVCDVWEPVAVTDNTVSQAPVTMALKPESENNINIVTNLTTPTAALTVEHRFSNEHFQRFHHIELNETSR